MLETAGLPTVGTYIDAFAHVPDRLRVARALITDHPMGRPLGAPHDHTRHLAVVRSALTMLAADGAHIERFPEPYRAAGLAPRSP